VSSTALKREPALEALHISKRFAEVLALDDVSLKLEQGSFHALLGENGAGKSTLVKCIMGYYQPDDGELMIAGKQVTMSNPHAAHDVGIGMVYQHFTLIPNMTVLENIVLSRSHLPPVIDWKKERTAVEEKMANMPFQIPLSTSVNKLAAGEKQKVEIVKQLLLDINILILDEPTSVLTPSEADEVLGQIKAMTQTGHLSVLIITHKFREVMEYSADVTVLRKGAYAGSAKVSDVDPQKLANMMVGHEYRSTALQRTMTTESDAVLSLSHLCTDDDSGVPALNDFSLHVGGGEIVGIAGVSGNGQRELVEVLAGQRDASQGEIKVQDDLYQARRAQMAKHKFHVLPEEPLRNASVASMSVADNLAFRRFDRSPFAYKQWILNRTAIKKSAVSLIERFGIRTAGPDQAIGNLSGGNVQRTVLARELEHHADVLVVANPCFGLDFSATSDIREKIMQARNRGAAVLLISEDLDEILELSDRVMVISGGQLVYETTPDKADLTTVGQYMAGH